MSASKGLHIDECIESARLHGLRVDAAETQFAYLRAEADKVPALTAKITELQNSIKLLDAALSIPDHPKAMLIIAKAEAFDAVRAHHDDLGPSSERMCWIEVQSQIARLDSEFPKEPTDADA